VRDGEPLPGISVVVGTSIGSLSGCSLVATGQYALVAELWHGIAAQRLLEIEPRCRAVVRPSSCIFTRVYDALALEPGPVTNVTSVLDRDRVANGIAKLVKLRERRRDRRGEPRDRGAANAAEIAALGEARERGCAPLRRECRRAGTCAFLATIFPAELAVLRPRRSGRRYGRFRSI